MIRTALTAILLVLALGARVPAQRESAHKEPARFEADIKAAFLYQFSRYVDWPASVFGGSRTAPFKVCIMAADPFGQILDRILEGETALGHAMHRVSLDGATSARGCQILYVESDEMTRAQPLLATVQASPVLTVGDAPDFLAHGGHIRLFRDDDHIRFDVNQVAARKSGIMLSSQLLRIARKVITDRRPTP